MSRASRWLGETGQIWHRVSRKSPLAFCDGALLSLVLLIVFISVSSLPGVTRTRDIVMGANAVNPMRYSVADQDALFDQLAKYHVRVIRCGISNDEKGIDFAKRATAKGLQIQLIVNAQYPKDGPTRPYSDAFPAMWGGHPLSSADPELSKAFFQKLFDSLDANEIKVAGVELDNEINWAAFNAEFPLPGEGKILTYNDLLHDPEGKKIAKGFLQYLKVMAALKDIRDHSRLNQNAPIISAGLVAAIDGDKLYNNKKEDMVSVLATIRFLREHGLDSVVDVYGLHQYPMTWKPGTPEGFAARSRQFNLQLSECYSGGAVGKPCWVTEWGFGNTDFSCPPKETNQVQLVKEMRDIFGKAAKDGHLAGLTYYSWNADPWSKNRQDPSMVYRCGVLTETGKRAVAPMKAK